MNELTAKDLMVGDIVDVHRSECVADGGHYMEWNEYGKVVSITEDYITIKYNGREDDYGFDDVDEKDINPIPLTSDILEKNGFIIKKKWAQLGNFGNSPLIMWHFVDDPILRNYNTELEIHQNDTGKVHVRIPCKYAHELQHALRLVGIDKEIELW